MSYWSYVSYRAGPFDAAVGTTDASKRFRHSAAVLDTALPADHCPQTGFTSGNHLPLCSLSVSANCSDTFGRSDRMSWFSLGSLV
ncbi:hypothetical protein Enr13x_00820 [Stieleria neptunia]|uniref:Uncharacterized protein n=1 Tax=Stieleria neptunia TaxID=2527979 RepID=A0A518HHF6_9BACT|nr:hypothetical protein Enr13x_00820 [Stieleria neptunia]